MRRSSHDYENQVLEENSYSKTKKDRPTSDRGRRTQNSNFRQLKVQKTTRPMKVLLDQ